MSYKTLWHPYQQLPTFGANTMPLKALLLVLVMFGTELAGRAVDYSLPDKATISKNPINGVLVQKDLAKTQLHINAVDAEGNRCERMLQAQALSYARLCNPSALATEEYLAHQQRMASEWQEVATTRESLAKQAEGLQAWAARLKAEQAELARDKAETLQILNEAEALVKGVAR